MLRFVLITALAAFALEESARASSIVFVKRGDVWIANAKGKRQKAITKNGTPSNPYRSPAYSDKGVITAVKGRRTIHFFNRRGKRLRRARDLTGGPTPPFDPVIIDHSISPNGRRLASTLWLTTRDATPKPGEPTGTDYGTSVWYSQTRSGKLLPGTTDGGQSVTWAGNALPVVFAPHVYHSADAWLVDLGRPNSPTQWFQDRATVDPLDPSDGEPLDDGELTRARDKIAVVRGPNTTASAAPTMIRVYAVSSLSARPAERCDLRAAPNSRIESPSWSPDGRRLAWSERDGIWATPIAAASTGCGAAPKRLIAGGSQPDWGPARR
jgi:WD40-like Beta Propeller Repeat